MPVYITKIQHSVTSQEDLMMLSPIEGPGTGPAPFDRAAQALVDAWAPLLPRGAAVVTARPDTSSKEAPRR
jgi:hypothetical protein